MYIANNFLKKTFNLQGDFWKEDNLGATQIKPFGGELAPLQRVPHS